MIASYRGVFRYDGKSFTNITSKLSLPSFWDVLEDRNGNLWFASRDSGVYCYTGNSFEHFTTREGLVNNIVFNICEDKAGNIWFAMEGGASCYDGKSFRNFTTEEGLPNNDVNIIIEDKPENYGLAQGVVPASMMERRLPILRVKMANLLPMFVLNRR